jgi:hypothetical protein
MAKFIHELETLLAYPKLSSIQIVRDSIDPIKKTSAQLRLSAQERLLTAVNEQNQATIAEALQLFYNLKSLPETVLMVIDNAVKHTGEISAVSSDVYAF